MDIPLKKLVRLLQSEQPSDTRAAAARVLGDLGAKDAAAELTALLTDPDPDVRLAAIRAVGQVKADKALPTLLNKVTHGGPEAAPAAEAAVGLGAKGVKGLQELLHKVAPGVRRYIAAALTNSGTEAAGVAVLVDKDPQIASSAAAALLNQIPTLTPAKRTTLAEELAAVAGDKKKPLPPTAEANVVRVLVALNEPAAADLLWDRVLPPHPIEVRALALQAVGGWATAPTKEQMRKLFACAADPDFRAAAPALMTLNRLPVADKALGDWVGLFHAPDAAARRLAVDKVGDRDMAEVAAGLLAQFAHPDRGLRDAARAKLLALKAGRAAVLDALLAADTTDAAWTFARATAGFKDGLSPAAKTKVYQAACEHLAAHDHRADALFFLLREADHTDLQDKLVETATGLRKKKKYEAALEYLKVVARDPSIGFAVRLELAFNGLKTSAKEVDPHARDGDPTLRNFDTLLQQDGLLLLKELEKAKFLDADDLFYVGFHFAEQIGRPRQFGIDVLQLVLKRDPKSEAGKAARNKLKSVGA